MAGDDTNDLVLEDAGEGEYMVIVAAVSEWAIKEVQTGDVEMGRFLSRIVAKLTLDNPEISREALKNTPSDHILGEEGGLLAELGLTVDDEGIIREAKEDLDDAVSIDVE